MKRKRFAPEKIIRMLREAEVSLFQGLTVGQVSRQLGISEQNYSVFVIPSMLSSLRQEKLGLQITKQKYCCFLIFKTSKRSCEPYHI